MIWEASILLLFVQLASGVNVANPTEDLASDCNFSFNNTQGDSVISSLKFGTGVNYPDNKRCGWLIESPEEAADIAISFQTFNIEGSKRCKVYDHVLLYKQGNGQNDWTPIGYAEGYCGKQDPFVVSASTKRVFILFVADSNRNFEGFNATFNIQITDAAPKIVCLSKLNDKSCNDTIHTEARAVLTIQCKATAIPPASFKWEKMINSSHGVEIRNEMVKNVFPNGSIQIHQLLMSDGGSYRCIANNKHGSDDRQVHLIVAEKCRCPKMLRTSWYNYPPYTRYTVSGKKSKPTYKGIFYVILDKMIQSVCGNCSKGHGSSTIIWDDFKNKKKSLVEVKAEIEDASKDIYFPIEGGKLSDKYRNVFYFLPAVASPGVAFMVIGDESGASAMAIFDSIIQGWPILVLTIVMAILAGIIMWMLDTYWNEEQLPRNFSEGIIEGFWWAFVTMTTVGYGDIAPVGVPGRLFAIIWILTGLVIIAIFTGVITTSLTVVALSTNVKLYGTTVGALNNTAEYRMGVIKNAEMKNYSNFETLKAAMDTRIVKGSLVDSYVAAHQKKTFNTFRVNNIFTSNKAFGIVLGKSLSTKYLYDEFKNYLENNKALITADIEANTETLTEPKESAAMEKSSDLFSPKSPLFIKSIMASTIMLLLLTMGGLLFEYGYLRPRHRMIEAAKNLEMVESEEVKQMARRARSLKEALLHEVQEFYDRWAEKLGNLTKKHKAEQKKLLSKGSSTGPGPAACQLPPAEEAVELDYTDVVDKRPPSSGSSAGSSEASTSRSKSEFMFNKSSTSLKDAGKSTTMLNNSVMSLNKSTVSVKEAEKSSASLKSTGNEESKDL